MDTTYNSPPNWPPPPAGWTPAPGWRPDPSWGPAPPGWQFWIEVPDKTERAPMGTPSSAGDQELRIFLSYRRSDCQAQANGLYDGLRNRLPEARVFMDIDSIPAGVDFEEHIQREISVCDLVLVMIGDNWLDARQGSDVRRIDEPEDFVRLEIESALSSAQVRTMPVLVENAQMPGSAELPATIARLARINAIELSDMRWRADLDRLVDAVEALGLEKGKIAPSAAAPTPTPAVPPAPAARTSLSIGAVGNVGQDPGEVRSEEQRTPAVAWVLMAVPFLSLGFAAWVPALWAGLKRPVGTRARRHLFALSAGLLGAVFVAIFLVAIAPEDPDGGSSGAVLAIGSLLWLLTMVVGTVVAVAFRKPPVD